MPTAASSVARGRVDLQQFVVSFDSPEQLHPVGGALVAEDGLTTERIQYISRTDGGGVLVSHRLTGDCGPVEDVLRTNAAVTTWAVSAGGAEVHTFVVLDRPSPLGELIGVLERAPLVIDLPIACLDSGGLRVRLAGDRQTIRAVLERVPETLQIEFDRIGQYRPGRRDQFGALTTRQVEVLTTAVELGYYAYPRETTCEEVASALDISSTTVCEHLQRIEARILSGLV